MMAYYAINNNDTERRYSQYTAKYDRLKRIFTMLRGSWLSNMKSTGFVVRIQDMNLSSGNYQLGDFGHVT